ncbi:methyltransferase domain-containing protein [Bacillus sp. BRMEA1]|uniref:class I SAM-dependent methyltransferase n=1 Tax=Neobacillus endophyticus TaxID=2738405 RepID=UPI001565FD8C|nr:methyltransferase domain-containing protein [Neobacillus endophyticus]NRD78521.1 methyltransferase domain-containing protein [Neobacillus endophyticus]
MDFHKDLSNVGWEEVKRRQLERVPLVYEWMKLADMKQGESVLDIGIGPGVFTLQYANSVGEEGTIYALDKSEEALDFFLRDVKEKMNNIIPICRNAETSLDAVGNVDIVMITDVLHHADSPIDLLRNVYKHINVDVRVLIAEFDKDSKGQIGPPLQNRISKEEVKKFAKSVGFQEVKDGNQDYEHYYMLLKK